MSARTSLHARPVAWWSTRAAYSRLALRSGAGASYAARIASRASAGTSALYMRRGAIDKLMSIASVHPMRRVEVSLRARVGTRKGLRSSMFQQMTTSGTSKPRKGRKPPPIRVYGIIPKQARQTATVRAVLHILGAALRARAANLAGGRPRDSLGPCKSVRQNPYYPAACRGCIVPPAREPSCPGRRCSGRVFRRTRERASHADDRRVCRCRPVSRRR